MGCSPPHLADPPELTGAPTVPWTMRDVGLGLGFFALWFIGALLASGFAAAAWPQLDPAAVASATELTLLIPVWWLGIRKHRVGWPALGFRRFRLVALAAGIGLILSVYSLNCCYSAFLSLFRTSPQGDLLYQVADTRSPLLLLLTGSIVAPFAEEVFFRGFIYAGMRRRLGKIRAAILSGLLFALAHFTPLAAPPMFALGLGFALLYEWSGSIWPSTVIHMLNNAVALGLAMFVLRSGIALP